MEQYDYFLKTLMIADQKRGTFISSKSLLDKHRLHFSPDKTIKAIDYLESKGFIQTSAKKIKGLPIFIRVTPDAYDYFKEKEATKALLALKRVSIHENPQYSAEIFEPEPTRRKNTLKVYVAGIISGVFLMWIKTAFFS